MASKPRTTWVVKSVSKPRRRSLDLDRAGGYGELARVNQRIPEGGGPNESSSRKSGPGSAQEQGRAFVLVGWRE